MIKNLNYVDLIPYVENDSSIIKYLDYNDKLSPIFAYALSMGVYNIGYVSECLNDDILRFLSESFGSKSVIAKHLINEYCDRYEIHRNPFSITCGNSILRIGNVIQFEYDISDMKKDEIEELE